MAGGAAVARSLAVAALLAAAAPATAAPAIAPSAVRFDGDRIVAPLTGAPGDPARGRAIVIDRRVGLCLLCHRGPFPDEPTQGDLGGDLSGVGARLDAAQLRQRIVDPRRRRPATVMPAFYRTDDGLQRVGAAFRGRPVLDAQQVEDVVAFLATLR